MNVWAIVVVVLVAAVILGILSYRADRSGKSFWEGFLAGGFGCLAMLFNLFISLVSLFALYLLFTWIFG